MPNEVNWPESMWKEISEAVVKEVAKVRIAQKGSKGPGSNILGCQSSNRGHPLAGHERRSESRQAKGERGVWQRRYWEHLIRDERDYARHVDYVHYNPVNHCSVNV